MAGCGVQAIRVSCPYRLSGAAAVAYVRTELSTRNVGISIMVETLGSTAIRNERLVGCTQARLAWQSGMVCFGLSKHWRGQRSGPVVGVSRREETGSQFNKKTDGNFESSTAIGRRQEQES